MATPTLFRTDSQISALQATGCIGCSDNGISFQCFRGVFQALETALPGDALQVEHIPGHTQEPFNDMVDWLAKKGEREELLLPTAEDFYGRVASTSSSSLDFLQLQ